jgi:hypothetical protein
MADMLLPGHLAWIGLGAFIIIAFTGYWFPRELEGAGEGRLPRNFQVSVLFALMNLVLFAFILAFVFFSSNVTIILEVLIASGSADTEAAEKLRKELAKAETANVILAALGVYFGLFGFERWRRIQAGILRQLHSVSLVQDDQENLVARLERCPFVDKAIAAEADYEEEDEAAKGILALERLQRRCKPGDVDNPARSLAVKARKLQALLNLWQKDVWGAALPIAERPNCALLQLAHERRTTLAARVEDYANRIERGEVDPSELAAISASLKEGSMTSEDALAKFVELSADPSPEQDNGRTLEQIVAPLVEFLDKGYRESLRELASATAKTAILSGDDAQDRLDALIKVGFSGIGQISSIDLDRAISITLLVFVFVVAVFFTALNLPLLDLDQNQNVRKPFIFVISGSLTIAVVVGTMVGGLRKLANARNTPWFWYILAAVVMGVWHVVAVLCASVLDLTMESGNPAHRPVHFAMAGALVPFSVVLGICLLSRCKDPVGILPDRFFKSLPERLADCLCFSSIVLIGGVAFNIVVEVAQLPPPVAGADFGDRMRLIGFVTLMVGAFVGLVVIHHVRAAALSRIVEEDNGPAVSPPASTRTQPPPASPTPAAT